MSAGGRELGIQRMREKALERQEPEGGKWGA